MKRNPQIDLVRIGLADKAAEAGEKRLSGAVVTVVWQSSINQRNLVFRLFPRCAGCQRDHVCVMNRELPRSYGL